MSSFDKFKNFELIFLIIKCVLAISYLIYYFITYHKKFDNINDTEKLKEYIKNKTTYKIVVGSITSIVYLVFYIMSV